MQKTAVNIERWLDQSFHCECGRQHIVPLKKVVIEQGAVEQVPLYLNNQGYTTVTLVADSRTFNAAGTKVKEQLENNHINVSLSLLKDGDVVAHEATIVKVLLDIPANNEAIIAVGSGTIHDIVRFVSSKTSSAFISVPTAPSVDGFASVGAPLLIQGFKQTVPACAPEAIFADLNVLCAAPQEMVAAGVGDMLGKFTSLADWQLGRILFDEYYCPLAAEMTKEALILCIENIEGIRYRTSSGVEKLMRGLILSGISMLLVGSSRPASGAEHHLSHYWEMRWIRDGKKSLLHGKKVGVACILMAKYYNTLKKLTKKEIAAGMERLVPPNLKEDERNIQKVYGEIAAQVLRENDRAEVSQMYTEDFKSVILNHWDDIVETAHQVPDPGLLSHWLKTVGGVTTTEALGIDEELKREALNYSFYIRSRFTVLRLNRWIEGDKSN